MNMVEKVAKAMAAAESGPEGSSLFSVHWDEFGDGYMDSARVAIEAMREPTEEMQGAALAKIGYEVDWVAGLMGSSYSAGVQVFADVYTAMIDGALAEEKSDG